MEGTKATDRAEERKTKSSLVRLYHIQFHSSAKHHFSKNSHVIKTGLQKYKFVLLEAIYKLQLNTAESIQSSKAVQLEMGEVKEREPFTQLVNTLFIGHSPALEYPEFLNIS